jgi:hypothetical protein
MCRRVTCATCGKPTWAGCGKHIEQALTGVPAAERCKCKGVGALPARVVQSAKGSRWPTG